MPKLTFDNEGKRYLENGVSHGILFVLKDKFTAVEEVTAQTFKKGTYYTQTGTAPNYEYVLAASFTQDTTYYVKDGKEYATGVAWDGLISVAQNPEGAENEDIYADNIKYATLTSAETFGATISAYTYPDEFELCDGSFTKTGTGIYVGQQVRTPFAFAYRTNITNDQGLDGHILHIVYGAKASPSEREYSTTTDSPEGTEMSWEVSTTPVNVTGTVGGVAVRPVSHIQIFEYDKKTGALNPNYADIEADLLGGENTYSALPSAQSLIDLIKDAE